MRCSRLFYLLIKACELSLVCYEQMRHTCGSHIPGTSQDEDGIPDPPPVPPNLADAIAALVNVTVDNARLLREIAQSNQNMMQGNRGRNQNMQEATYVDFTYARPPVFTKAMNHWRLMIGFGPWSKNLILFHAWRFRNLCLPPINLEVQQVLGGQT